MCQFTPDRASTERLPNHASFAFENLDGNHLITLLMRPVLPAHPLSLQSRRS